jgi:hypothetical protein
MFKLPGMSTSEEKQLEQLLEEKTILSREERKYLIRYVIKGLPERLHGRVTTNIISTYRNY